MGTLLTDKYLSFNGKYSDSPPTIDAQDEFQLSNSSGSVSYNADGDGGGLDEFIDAFNLGGDVFIYSGFTINLNGREYAIFADDIFASSTVFYVPFDSNVDDLSSFNADDLNPSAITYTPENAVTANCFLTGTMIATPNGERAIEELDTGDLVRTADGRDVAIHWRAKQTVQVSPFLAGGRTPVRIKAGALGENLPHTDLLVSADHAMVLDGLLINAAVLVNHGTIVFEPLSDLPMHITYWHIETGGHEVLLANGAPSESFIDYTGRAAFDNFDDYLALYGAERIIPEMPLPRISSARMLPKSLKERLGISDHRDAMSVAQTA